MKSPKRPLRTQRTSGLGAGTPLALRVAHRKLCSIRKALGWRLECLCRLTLAVLKLWSVVATLGLRTKRLRRIEMPSPRRVPHSAFRVPYRIVSWRPISIRRTKPPQERRVRGFWPQRGHDFKPRVVPARRDYPGSASGKPRQPQRGCASSLVHCRSIAMGVGEKRHNPRRGCFRGCDHNPRVAALRQPWAGSQNAFGVSRFPLPRFAPNRTLRSPRMNCHGRPKNKSSHALP